jgi:hypothetical protein
MERFAKIAFSAPSGSEMNIGCLAASDLFRRGEWLGVSNANSQRIDIVATEPTVIHVSGTLTIGASIPGDFRLKWAQFASSTDAVTVKKGSYL